MNVGTVAPVLAPTNYTVDHTYWEVGTRFQQFFEELATDKCGQSTTSNILWGIEPFQGCFDEDQTLSGTLIGKTAWIRTFPAS